MDNTREKLIDLMTEFYGVDPGYYGVEAYPLAEHLIANGVTIQKWIPVTEPPKEPGVYQVFGYCKDWKRKKSWYGRWIHNQWFVNGICGGKMSYEVTHWMPLPEPPKGE